MHGSPWLKMVYRRINEHAKGMIFITDNEEKHFREVLGGTFQAGKSAVVYNSLEPSQAKLHPLPLFQEPKAAFRVISLSSYSPNRGTDLVAHVARSLKDKGREDFFFFLCGRLGARSLLPWKRDEFLNKMNRGIDELGVRHMVKLAGFVEEPERALMGCHALIQIRRRQNPWGREIMEAMSQGLPVLAWGTYEGFVEHGTNGFLVRGEGKESRPDVLAFADALIRLKDDPGLYERMSTANRQKAKILFDPSVSARKVEKIYRTVLMP
jgi:glycosyltransferase involved in cell wall biosynthesis